MVRTLKKGAFVVALSAIVTLSGCTNSGMSNSETRAVVGSIVGGAIGREFGGGRGRHVMTALGAAVGGFIGANIGREFDTYDQNHINTALQNTPDNRQVRWNNRNSGATYVFTPTSSYQTSVNNRPTRCRSYTMLVDMEGSPQRVQGRACYVNGRWLAAQ
ncbi:MAG: hypothetical protein CSB47_07690 [Proteobacteria bacterium]|nr:MAG: hypothetical protein CSB47_07690 [Pseudomonadota bacterium]